MNDQSFKSSWMRKQHNVKSPDFVDNVSIQQSIACSVYLSFNTMWKNSVIGFFADIVHCEQDGVITKCLIFGKDIFLIDVFLAVAVVICHFALLCNPYFRTRTALTPSTTVRGSLPSLLLNCHPCPCQRLKRHLKLTFFVATSLMTNDTFVV